MYVEEIALLKERVAKAEALEMTIGQLKEGLETLPQIGYIEFTLGDRCSATWASATGSRPISICWINKIPDLRNKIIDALAAVLAKEIAVLIKELDDV